MILTKKERTALLEVVEQEIEMTEYFGEKEGLTKQGKSFLITMRLVLGKLKG